MNIDIKPLLLVLFPSQTSAFAYKYAVLYSRNLAQGA